MRFQNEDILEYIKYDVAFEILRHNRKFEKLEFDKNLFRQVYFYENYKNAISILAEGASKVDQRLSAVLQSLKALKVHIDEAQGQVKWIKKDYCSEDNDNSEAINNWTKELNQKRLLKM